MAKPLPGKNQPTPIRPKSVISVSSRGKVNVGSVIKHPSEVERIAFTHRVATSKFNTIKRALDPNLHKKR